MGRKKITQEDFFNRVRNPNYDFSNTIFINLHTPIEVVCIFHGLFKILPKNMLYKDEGCKFCGMEKMAKSKSLTKQDFIKKAEKLFPNLFDYSLISTSLLGLSNSFYFFICFRCVIACLFFL